jgi:hypothetical protein
MLRLIVHELALARERQPREVLPAPEVVGTGDAGRAPPPTEERVAASGGQRLAHERAEALPLVLAQTDAVERFQPRVEHRQARSLKRWILPVAVFGSSDTNSIQRGYL